MPKRHIQSNLSTHWTNAFFFGFSFNFNHCPWAILFINWMGFSLWPFFCFFLFFFSSVYIPLYLTNRRSIKTKTKIIIFFIFFSLFLSFYFSYLVDGKAEKKLFICMNSINAEGTYSDAAISILHCFYATSIKAKTKNTKKRGKKRTTKQWKIIINENKI